jgi:hypothetical protein
MSLNRNFHNPFLLETLFFDPFLLGLMTRAPVFATGADPSSTASSRSRGRPIFPSPDARRDNGRRAAARLRG